MFLPPVFWMMTFTYNWVVRDDVVALADLQQSMRNSMSAWSWFSIGAFSGAMISVWFCVSRWFHGRWPDER